MPPSGGGGVGGWPLTFFRPTPFASNAGALSAANVILRSGFVLEASIRFSTIGVYVSGTDNANNYDLGIYTQAGGLLANIGPQTLPSGGLQTFNTVQGPLTIGPGLFVFAWTGAANTAVLQQGVNGANWVFSNSATPSTLGTLPSSIAASTVSPDLNSLYFLLE